jgi:putative NIF3 family GTP cyclohydrolase 1 type 2
VTDHVRLDDVVGFLDERIEVAKFDEVESNGLIVRASDVVTSVAAAVSTSFHAILRAKSTQADLLIVHHRSWPEIDLELVREKHERLRQNGISLSARIPRSTVLRASPTVTASLRRPE